MQQCTIDVNILQRDGDFRNGTHHESIEVLGTCTVGYRSVVSSCMEIVGENQREEGQEARLRKTFAFAEMIDSTNAKRKI